MNEDKVITIITNLKKFNNDLMDLNIKYAEELEKMQNMKKELMLYLDKVQSNIPEGYVMNIRSIFDEK